MSCKYCKRPFDQQDWESILCHLLGSCIPISLTGEEEDWDQDGCEDWNDPPVVDARVHIRQPHFHQPSPPQLDFSVYSLNCQTFVIPKWYSGLPSEASIVKLAESHFKYNIGDTSRGAMIAAVLDDMYASAFGKTMRQLNNNGHITNIRDYKEPVK